MSVGTQILIIYDFQLVMEWHSLLAWFRVSNHFPQQLLLTWFMVQQICLIFRVIGGVSGADFPISAIINAYVHRTVDWKDFLSEPWSNCSLLSLHKYWLECDDDVLYARILSCTLASLIQPMFWIIEHITLFSIVCHCSICQILSENQQLYSKLHNTMH